MKRSAKQNIPHSVLRSLTTPVRDSHKGQNGILYIAAGSQQYHGALWYAIEAASHFVDLIYVETDVSNHGLVRKLKQLHPAMILVSARHRKQYLERSDCLLLGPGLGKSPKTKKLVTQLLNSTYCPDKVVLDADALRYCKPHALSDACVLTPHKGEFEELFGKRKPETVARELNCVLVLKGSQDVVCQKNKCRYNNSGTAGLTKGGTGDVLAGVIAALSCTNSVWQSSQAAVLLNGLAAEDLRSTLGTYFSTDDLISQLPYTLHEWQQKRRKTTVKAR